MTPQETTQIIRILNAVSPNSRIQKETIEAWAYTMRDLPFDASRKAALHWIETEKWFPSPVEFREKVAEVEFGIRSPEAAWEHVLEYTRAAAATSRSNPVELADIEIEAVRAIGGMSMVRSSDNQEKLGKRFMETYKELARRKFGEQLNYLAPGYKELAS